MGVNPIFVLKILMLIGLLMYLAFGLVVVRQVQLMSQVVGGGGQQGIKIITIIHLVIIILIFVIAVIAL